MTQPATPPAPPADRAVLPAFLRESVAGPLPAAAPGRRSRRRGFLEKTLASIGGFVRDEVFCEHLARESGLLQGVDPRARLVTVFLLIILAGLCRQALSLILLNLWVIWLARCSRVPVGFFIRRVWLVVLVFTGIVVVPVLFNVVRPGTTLVPVLSLPRSYQLGPWFTLPATIAITREGLFAACLLLLRVGASVSLAVLLTLTSRWSALLKSLAVCGIPQVFLAVLDMSHRYVFLLLQTSSDLFLARESRLAGRTGTREGRRFVASVMGNLWGKTTVLSEEVHGAMRARGYTGAPRTLAPLAMRGSDIVWIGLVLVVAGLLWGMDHVQF